MIYWFIFGCAGSSLLHGLFSSCGERGLLSSVLASHCHGFSCCRPQILGRMSFSSYGSWAVETGSAATAHKFSCSMACGDFPRSGIKSMSPTLSGGFFTTQQPGKPWGHVAFYILFSTHLGTWLPHTSFPCYTINCRHNECISFCTLLLLGKVVVPVYCCILRVTGKGEFYLLRTWDGNSIWCETFSCFWGQMF